MSLVKRGRFYHYDFVYRGIRHQGSTNQTNINKARLTEAKIRSDVALEHFGVGPVKQSPMFIDFMETRFLPHVRQHNAQKRRTVAFYTEKTKRLLEYKPFLEMRMSDVDEESAAAFALWRGRVAVVSHTAQPLTHLACHEPTAISIATINGELRTLRRAVLLAYEWRLIQRRPRIRTLPGEHQREFVLTRDMEAAYLAVADYPLKQAAILMLDQGIRPEECVSLRKADIGVIEHRYAFASIRSGKTKNAVRSLPLTERSAEVVAFLFDLWPESEWLFPGKKGTHYTRGALDNAHKRLKRSAATSDNHATSAHLRKAGEQMRERGVSADAATIFPDDFVLYSFRHTFATRLAESGAREFELMKILGHSSVVTSQRYIHMGSESVSRAMAQKELFDRHMSGDHEETSTVDKN